MFRACSFAVKLARERSSFAISPGKRRWPGGCRTPFDERMPAPWKRTRFEECVVRRVVKGLLAGACLETEYSIAALNLSVSCPAWRQHSRSTLQADMAVSRQHMLACTVAALFAAGRVDGSTAQEVGHMLKAILCDELNGHIRI